MTCDWVERTNERYPIREPQQCINELAQRSYHLHVAQSMRTDIYVLGLGDSGVVFLHMQCARAVCLVDKFMHMLWVQLYVW